MTTLSLAVTASPATALADDRVAGDELFSLPAWLYRSEAFAEDLPGAAAALAAAPEATAPRASRRGLPTVLYLATLMLAVAASVPGAISA